jgi:DNA-binding response OmpR family regulator
MRADTEREPVIDLLLVEDEAHLREGLALNFGAEGYRVATARTLAEARALLDADRFNLIVLDLMLPDGNGLELCAELRRRRDFTPILILTAKGQQKEIVLGLEQGADDYLAKPFHLTELLSRTRGLLRRQRWAQEPEIERLPTSIGDAVIDWNAQTFKRDGEIRRLTGLETKLLAHFVDHQGRTLSREALLENVWGLTGYQTRTVDNFVSRLRRYFEENPSEPIHFVTVRGAGYRFEVVE